MVIANNNLIEADDLNEVFSDAAPALTALGGLSRGLNAQKNLNNGYSSIRFRQEQFALSPAPPTAPVIYKFRFTSPDDLDILCVGMTIKVLTSLSPAGQRVRATLKGVVTDLENDLPVANHLFLTEPVFNVDGKNYIELEPPAGVADAWSATRYVTYERNQNRPCNTLLKGATYDLDIENTALDYSAGGLWSVEVLISYKTKLRRN